MVTSDNTTPFAAADYDKSVRQTIPFYDNIQSETVDLVRTLKPDVNCWLDTGCGTGYLVEMALRYFPQTRFILTDPSAPMLKKAISRLQGISEKQIRFLPLTRSESLLMYKDEIKPQVVTAILSHHYLEKSQRCRATEACYELLDNAGVFVTFENIAPCTQQSTLLALDRWKRFQVEHGRTSSAAEEHARRFNTNYFPITVNEHFELLRQTGFQVVELFWISHMQAGFYAIK